MARILVHTLGSSGDFNPFIALAFSLQNRGHKIKFAVNPSNASKLRALGFEAVDLGPDLDPQSELMKRLLQASITQPLDILFRELLIPSIAPATEALVPLCLEADLFISHTIQLGAPAVAYKTGIPWISAIPATNCYPSAELPAPSVAWNNSPGALTKFVWETARVMFRPIDDLANEEYRKIGVPPRKDIVIGGSYSPLLTIGMWSPAFFPRPSDWPDWFQLGGYGRWDGPPPPGTASFKAPEGSSPLVVFTLGSSVVNDARGFYQMALEAISQTDWRAVLLGVPADFTVPGDLQERVTAAAYAPYSAVFPQADAIVHQGGVGTTQAACYYGVPAVVAPRGFDQFENAAHIQRNGWGLRLVPKNLSPELLRIRVGRLLKSAEMKQKVKDLSILMQTERGAEANADLVESVLSKVGEPRTALEIPITV